MKFLALVLLFAGTFVRGEDEVPCLDQDLNAYLDKILEKARKEIDDPLRLPPKSTFVELSEGRAWGMSTLYRSGPVIVTCHENDTIILSGKLGVEEIKGRYTWEKDFSKKTRSGFIVLLADNFEAEVRIVIPREKNVHNHPRLEQFKINKLENVRIEMTGMGWMTWALSEIVSLMSGIFQRSIAKAVEGPLTEALEREMREIDI